MRVRIAAMALAVAVAAIGGAADAQLFWFPPDFSGPPVTGDEPGIVPPIPGATPAEYRAALVWNMRAGLNVAALQCQFAPALRSVANYNALLAHHDKEFDAAQAGLLGYFKKQMPKDLKGAQNAFDQYSTRTYNSFSTLHAQLSFCQVAGTIARAALATPKGGFQQLAIDRMRELRNSLIPVGDKLFAFSTPLVVQLPDVIDPSCYKRDGTLRTDRKALKYCPRL